MSLHSGKLLLVCCICLRSLFRSCIFALPRRRRVYVVWPLFCHPLTWFEHSGWKKQFLIGTSDEAWNKTYFWQTVFVLLLLLLLFAAHNGFMYKKAETARWNSPAHNCRYRRHCLHHRRRRQPVNWLHISINILLVRVFFLSLLCVYNLIFIMYQIRGYGIITALRK